MAKIDINRANNDHSRSAKEEESGLLVGLGSIARTNERLRKSQDRYSPSSDIEQRTRYTSPPQPTS